MPILDEYLAWKEWNPIEFCSVNRSEQKYFSAELSRTGRNFSPGSRVLEIGFGNGNFLAYALQRGWDISGVENNPRLVELASKKVPAYAYAQLSELPDNSYDLIVAFDVLEHIPIDELPHFFSTVKRVLKDGGYFLARFPNGDSPFGLINQHGDITPVTTLGFGKIQYLMSPHNFKLIYFGGEKEVIFGKNPIQVLKRILIWGIKKLLNFFVNFISRPQKYGYCSTNLVVIIQTIRE
jgi:SAM-dependent methyltransferase